MGSQVSLKPPFVVVPADQLLSANRDFVSHLLNVPELSDYQVAKQLHITPPLPPSPAYPAYFLGPYLNIKQATQTYLCEKWKREQYVLKHPNDPPNLRAQSRITTSKIVSKHDRENANIPNFWFTLTGQVEQMGLGEFKGKQHSGIDVSLSTHIKYVSAS
jgi:hypothetical protein